MKVIFCYNNFMDSFFNPKSIVIIGVSHEKNKVGHLVAKNLISQNYSGKMYFVNHKFDGKILGQTVYKSLDEVIKKEKTIDLVVLAVPSTVAVLYLDELNKYKIKNAVIFAAGFRETNINGAKLEDELKIKAHKYGINILGPNCIGFVNTKLGVNATFFKNIVPSGNIGFISQSGALGSALVDYFLSHNHLGFSYFISLGNKSVIDESSCLEYLIEDKNTTAIFMYLEDVKNGEKFKRTLKKAIFKKPVIILKSGRTLEGAKAATSHTGGMASDDRIFNSLMEETGAIRADDYQEFLTLIKIFSYRRLPINDSILVLSNAGGAGVLLTDKLIKNELKMAMISKELAIKLNESFEESKKITIHNPIDLLGDASAFDYNKAFTVVKKEKNIGAVIVLLTPQANTQIYETAKVLVEMQKQYREPIYPVFMGKKSMFGIGKLFEKERIVGFANFDYLVSSIKKIVDYREYIKKGEVSELVAKLVDRMTSQPMSNSVILYSQKYDLFSSLQLIKSLNIPVAKTLLLQSEKEINTIVKEISFPVVAKISSEKITHKTEVRGVVVDIKNKQELIDVYKKLSKISKEVVVQEMVSGHELLIGAKRDPSYGVILALGLGGIYTELLQEVSFKIYPLSRFEFSLMLKKTKVGKLLNNFRGKGKINPDPIYKILCCLGQFMTNNPQINEIEINPLMVSTKNIIAVDCRIIK